MNLENQVCSLELAQKLKEIEENYIITEGGGVYSKPRKGANERRLKQHIVRGYQKVWFSLGGKVRAFTVHRLVAMKYLPNPQNLPQVNHKDGNKTNNHVSNLEWVSREEQEAHKRNVLGEDAKGEKNGNYGYRKAKLYPSEELRNRLVELGVPRYKHNLAELGEILPWQVSQKFKQFNDYEETFWYQLTCYKNDGSYSCGYINNQELGGQIFIDENEANCRAKMLIYLLENKIISLN